MVFEHNAEAKKMQQDQILFQNNIKTTKYNLFSVRIAVISLVVSIIALVVAIVK